MTSFFASFAQLLFEFVLVLAGPLTVIFAGRTMLCRIDRDDILRVPVLWYGAYASGILFGSGIIYSNFESDAFDWRNVFQPGAFWDLGSLEFLAGRAFPMLSRADWYDAALKDAPVLYGVAPVGILLACMLAGYMLSRGRDFFRGPFIVFALVVGIAYLTYTIIVLLAWSLNVLNFWILFMATWMLQRYRTAQRSA